MAKIRKAFFCSSCGYESPKWEGKCPSCNEWNTFTEEILEKPSKRDEKSAAWRSSSPQMKHKPKELLEVIGEDRDRIITPDSELNRVLGGGLVKGSLILIGGQPGIGKSTLIAKLCQNIDTCMILTLVIKYMVFWFYFKHTDYCIY